MRTLALIVLVWTSSSLMIGLTWAVLRWRELPAGAVRVTPAAAVPRPRQHADRPVEHA